MKIFAVGMFLIFLLPSTALSGNGYTCFMPRPDEIEKPRIKKPIEYLVYDGTSTQNAKTATMNTYNKLVRSHQAFFRVHTPNIKIYRRFAEILKATKTSPAPKRWRTIVVIGDKKGAIQLRNRGRPVIAFVPSKKNLKARILRELKVTTKMNYYTVAVDHALRRVTRMAAKLDKPGLSIVTPEHIIADTKLGNK